MKKTISIIVLAAAVIGMTGCEPMFTHKLLGEGNPSNLKVNFIWTGLYAPGELDQISQGYSEFPENVAAMENCDGIYVVNVQTYKNGSSVLGGWHEHNIYEQTPGTAPDESEFIDRASFCDCDAIQKQPDHYMGGYDLTCWAADNDDCFTEIPLADRLYNYHDTTSLFCSALPDGAKGIPFYNEQTRRTNSRVWAAWEKFTASGAPVTEVDANFKYVGCYYVDFNFKLNLNNNLVVNAPAIPTKVNTIVPNVDIFFTGLSKGLDPETIKPNSVNCTLESYVSDHFDGTYAAYAYGIYGLVNGERAYMYITWLTESAQHKSLFIYKKIDITDYIEKLDPEGYNNYDGSVDLGTIDLTATAYMKDSPTGWNMDYGKVVWNESE